MKTCTKCKVQKDPSGFCKSKAEKDGLQGKCKACNAEYVKANRESIAAKRVEYNKANRKSIAAKKAEYNKANRESIAAQQAKHRKANRESIAAKRVEYNKANRESIASKKAKWYQENREASAAQTAKYRRANRDSIAAKSAEWAKANPDKLRATSAKRRAAKLQRTPAWVDFEAIQAVYIEAARLEALDGVARHVDHVIPLQGELVSGLHIHTNLQILTATENLSKGNRY